MVFAVGDIVHADSALADHPKYHICVLECGDDGSAACFLFLNSETGWRGDCVLNCAEIPCIPASRTGLSVVSFSQIVRMNARQLQLFRAKKIGRLDPKVARKLEAFAKTVPTLTKQERKIILEALSKIK